MQSIIKNEDLLILKDSKVIKDYPTLQEIIENQINMKPQLLDEEVKRFLKYDYFKVLSKAKEEWFLNTDETQYYMKSEIDCEFCGHRNLKNVCVIENKYTNKRLNIGTECLKKTGVGIGANVYKILAESKKEKRLEYIEELFPGIEEINNCDELLEKIEISGNEEIIQNYIKLGIKVEKYLELYVNNNTSDKKAEEILLEIERIIQEKVNEIKKINKLNIRKTNTSNREISA